jgi:hypothetical protein
MADKIKRSSDREAKATHIKLKKRLPSLQVNITKDSILQAIRGLTLEGLQKTIIKGISLNPHQSNL